jgi:hypothetical protein
MRDICRVVKVRESLLSSSNSHFSPDDACSVVNKEYKFHLVNEKGSRAEKSGLLIAEGTSGSGGVSGQHHF